MCGIVGYLGNKKKTVDVLLSGLKKLEYRGYDSAGIAILGKEKVYSQKNVGKVVELKKNTDQNFKGNLGIAHTRWATHGKPSVKNSHPHHDCRKKFG